MHVQAHVKWTTEGGRLGCQHWYVKKDVLEAHRIGQSLLEHLTAIAGFVCPDAIEHTAPQRTVRRGKKQRTKSWRREWHRMLRRGERQTLQLSHWYCSNIIMNAQSNRLEFDACCRGRGRPRTTQCKQCGRIRVASMHASCHRHRIVRGKTRQRHTESQCPGQAV